MSVYYLNVIRMLFACVVRYSIMNNKRDATVATITHVLSKFYGLSRFFLPRNVTTRLTTSAKSGSVVASQRQ